MKKSASLFLICLIISAILSLPVHADTPGRALILGTVYNLPPFSYIKNEKLTGIDIELIHEIAARLGIKIEINAYPWARVMLNLKAGKIDGAFSAYKTKERENFCIFTDIMHYDRLQLVVRKDRLFRFSDITDLYGKVIGKGRAVFISNEFDKAVQDGKIRVEELNDMDMSNIRKLHLGRVDAVVGSPDTLMYYVRQLGLDEDITLIEKPLRDQIPAYLVLSRVSRIENLNELGNRIIKILKTLHDDGTYNRIYDKYMDGLKKNI